jgi:hypothetical protein
VIQLKVYVLIHHDPYCHSECEPECCGQEPSTIEAIFFSKISAETVKNRLDEDNSHKNWEYEIEECNIINEDDVPNYGEIRW